MPQQLKQLTVLRFFAAMWVVAFHYWPDLGPVFPNVVSKGYLGVELFFVLSGFILSHVYLQAFGERRFSYLDFLWARLARIYPVHIVTLAGMGALIGVAVLVGVQAGENTIVWASLPAQLFLTQAWGLAPQGGWNHPSWSISAEWFAYLSFPGFAVAAWALRRRPRLAVAVACVLVVAMQIGFQQLAHFPLTRATIAWGALRIVPCFALGCAVYLAWSAEPLATPKASLRCAAGVLAAIVVAVQLGAWDWVTVCLFGALIYSLASMGSAGSKVLTAPQWVYLGEVSFAVYMICIPWQLVFGRAIHRLPGVADGALPLILWLVQYAGVIPVAMGFHHLVERPAREAMRRHGVPFVGANSRLRARLASLGAG